MNCIDVEGIGKYFHCSLFNRISQQMFYQYRILSTYADIFTNTNFLAEKKAQDIDENIVLEPHP